MMPYEDTDWTTADDTAKDTAQHFFTDSSGAHVTENADAPDTGNNVLIDSNGMYVRSGTDVLAEFGQEVTIRDAGSNRELVMTGTGFDIRQINGVAGFHLDCYPSVQLTNIWSVGELIMGGTPIELHGSNVTIDTTGSGGSGNITVKAAGNVVISDGTNTLWSGTAQQLADALNGGTTPDPVMYGGSFVKTVTASREITVFSNAEVRSMFGVASGKENQIGVSIMNGDYGAQAHRITSVNYRSSSGWNMYLDGNASAGAFRINYIVAVPSSALA